jgi:drug/metabolite transporter (DMT)-like permease
MAAAARHEHGGLCTRDRTNLKKFSRWFRLFALAFVLAVIFLGPADGGLEQTPPWRFVLAILPLLPGYFASCAYLKFLKEADELIRNVHYEAASKSFILVILLGFVYSLASQVFGEWEDAGAILWVIASVAYQVNYRRAWRRFDV